MITFQTSKGGYAKRTEENAMVDATIAIAINFNTTGEKLTKFAVLNNKKLYIPFDMLLNTRPLNFLMIYHIIKLFNENKVKILNIAGNGIYTLNKFYSQEQCDVYVYEFLKLIIENPLLENKIELIRTGGQTGIDEAGAKAANKLNISTLIHAPKNWIFRNKEGEDISNENLFKQRFYER